jgi:uncharacterized protein
VTATAGAAGIAPTEGSQRRCIVTGEVRERARLLRCVVGPDGAIVPDIEGRLPGRGLWLTPRRDIVERALQKRLFARAARRPVAVPPELADRIESLLARRCSDLLGLARRAGHAVAGFERVGEAVRDGRAELLLEARDGAEGGRRRVAAHARGVPIVGVLTATELGAAFGRERVVHAAVGGGALAARLLSELSRLGEMRQAAEARDGMGAASARAATADGGCESHD